MSKPVLVPTSKGNQSQGLAFPDKIEKYIFPKLISLNLQRLDQKFTKFLISH